MPRNCYMGKTFSIRLHKLFLHLMHLFLYSQFSYSLLS